MWLRVLVLAALVVPGAAVAGDCVDTLSNGERVLKQPVPTECTPVDYVKPVVFPWLKVATQAVEQPQPLVGSGEGVPLDELESGAVKTVLPTIEAGNGGVGGFSAGALERVGESDGAHGMPLNPHYASDVNYLRGFTRGQILRTRGSGI